MSVETAPSEPLIRTIAPHDTMYVAGTEEMYFTVGASAMTSIEAALRAAGKDPETVRSVLDFPCGHGRVLRHMKQRFPAARFTASDLDRDGVDFCGATFGATAIYSHVDPTQIPLPADEYDLIWVGSLLTHFDAQRWVPFLRFFASRLRPGGVLAFSAHGRTTHAWMTHKVYDYDLPPAVMARCIADYTRTGFGYVQYAGKNADYGVSLSTPMWVTEQISQVPELRLALYQEGGWVQHHDVVACVRGPIYWPNG